MPSLSDILGQDRAVATLRGALGAGRVHHAWVFHGPQGVGKMTAARAFAAMLLDPTLAPNLAGELEPDPGSETARLIAAGVHPDLHIVTKELALFSDDAQVRARKLMTIPRQVIDEHLIRPAALTARVSAGARAGKVFVVDEAELLDEGTQNAVLKTLEEPAPGTVIILVTSRESRLLPTIRSRCQRVAFNALDEASMRAWAKRDERMRAAGEEQREWLLMFADGSPGRAANALAQGLFSWSRTLAPMLEDASRGRFSPDMGKTMADLIEQYAQAWVDAREREQGRRQQGARQMFALLAHEAQGRSARPARPTTPSAAPRHRPPGRVRAQHRFECEPEVRVRGTGVVAGAREQPALDRDRRIPARPRAGSGRLLRRGRRLARQATGRARRGPSPRRPVRTRRDGGRSPRRPRLRGEALLLARLVHDHQPGGAVVLEQFDDLFHEGGVLLEVRVDQAPVHVHVERAEFRADVGGDLGAERRDQFEEDVLAAGHPVEGHLPVLRRDAVGALAGELDRALDQHQAQLLGPRGEDLAAQVGVGGVG